MIDCVNCQKETEQSTYIIQIGFAGKGVQEIRDDGLQDHPLLLVNVVNSSPVVSEKSETSCHAGRVCD